MIERLPEHYKSRRTAEAIMAPSAILASGVGASMAILAGAGFFPVLAMGALAYAALVALRLPRRPKGPLAGIDPMALSEPWRRFVQEALQARRRFAEIVSSVSPGPIRDRLAEIGARLEAGVQECWRVARRGDALVEGIATLDLDDVRARVADVRGRGPGSESGRQSWEHTVEALEAQLASGERLVQVATDARDRLQLLDARLDEAVARAVELSLRAGDVSELSGLGSDIDNLVSEMESLRQGLEEAGRAAATG